MHLRVGTSLLAFIRDDLKRNHTLKSINGLHSFEVITTTGLKKMLDLGMRWVSLAKISFYTLNSDRPEDFQCYMLCSDHLEGVRLAETSFQSGLA